MSALASCKSIVLNPKVKHRVLLLVGQPQELLAKPRCCPMFHPDVVHVKQTPHRVPER